MNLSMVLYAAHDKLERYNMPDSLKAQHTALQRRPCADERHGPRHGSITHDTLGWRPAGPAAGQHPHGRRYGEHRYQAHRNAMQQGGLLTEIGKHGLTARDLTIGVNWFLKVSVNEGGRLCVHPGLAGALV